MLERNLVFFDVRRLSIAGSDCVRRANLCAAAAVDAGVRIDVIDFAFADCLYRANGLTSTASNAVVTNYICHNLFLFFVSGPRGDLLPSTVRKRVIVCFLWVQN